MNAADYVAYYYGPGTGYSAAADSLGVVNVAFEPYAEQPVDVRRDDGTAFVFNSVYLTSAWDPIQQVTLTGYDAQGGIVGIETGVVNLTPTLVQVNWGPIVDLRITNTGSHLVLDNFLFFAEPANQPPVVDVAHSIVTGTINELPNVTGSLALDIATGAIAFTDIDQSDRPTAGVTKKDVVYHDASGQDITRELSAAQITAFKNAFLIVPEAGNTNNGKIDWGLTINDSALDFLGVGERDNLSVCTIVSNRVNSAAVSCCVWRSLLPVTCSAMEKHRPRSMVL